MAGLGDRFSGWINERAADWKGRIAGWLIGSTLDATEAIAAQVEPQILEIVQAQLDSLRALPELPPDVKQLLDRISVPKDGGVSIALIGFLLGIVATISTSMIRGFMEPVQQQLAKLTPFHIPGLSEVLDMQLRGKLKEGEYEDLVARAGWSKAWADRFLDLKHPVLPSNLALAAWLRNPEKYQVYKDNLEKLGLTASDVELLLELERKIPGVQDIIRYVVKEAYDEKTVAEFGQDEEYPAQAEADAAKTGVRPEQLKLEWRAHWDLPGVSAGYEMLHRGEITEEKLDRLLKARDIMPGWRKELKAISWSLPGRIELRMMALYGLIGRKELEEALIKDGLEKSFVPAVANMNLVRGIKSDIQTRYANGWIGPEDVLTELNAALEDPVMADKVFKTIVKNASAARTVTQKNLTLAQIEKGVRKTKISRAQGSVLIQELGYSVEEATFLLDVDVPVDDTDAAVKTRELTKGDILAALRAGTTTVEEARARLIELRYLPADADYILRVYTASIKPPADPVERDISKADITSAVKLGLVTPAQGYELLRRIGFGDEASTFILSLVPESSPFSPLNFDEFRTLTSSWRRSQGLSDEALPPAAQELRLQQARAVAEGRQPVLETLRVQIDTVRRNRRKGLITREQEIAELTKLGVPADYLAALVANDDARMAPPTPAP